MCVIRKKKRYAISWMEGLSYNSFLPGVYEHAGCFEGWVHVSHVHPFKIALNPYQDTNFSRLPHEAGDLFPVICIIFWQTTVKNVFEERESVDVRQGATTFSTELVAAPPSSQAC